MPDHQRHLLTCLLAEAILSVDQRLGNREREYRYLSIGRMVLGLYGLARYSEPVVSIQRVVSDGVHVYRLAADSAASFDRFHADWWREIATPFPTYGQIVDAACRAFTDS